MKRSWWFRFSILLLVVFVSGMMVIPTIFNYDKETKFPIKSKINLGLDLQGGLYMVLGVDFNRAYKDEIKNMARRMEAVLKDEELQVEMGELIVEDIKDPMHTLIIDPAQADEAKGLLLKFFGNQLRLTAEEGEVLTYGLTDIVKTTIEEQSVGKSIEVIRNRIDEFGVTEPEILAQGKNRIIVQLPGVKDIERAKKLIGETARLEFKLVNDKVPYGQVAKWVSDAEAAGIIHKNGERFSNYIAKVNKHAKKEIPRGYEIVFQKTVNRKSGLLESKIPYLVESAPRVSGDDLQDARVLIDQQKNEPYIRLNFNSAGATRFEKTTGENIGRRMGVILDGNLYMAPNIQGRIGGGVASITMGQGNFNQLMKQARDMALVLRAGALPVQLDFEEQRIVGPSLGAESITKARTAGLIGALLVFIFILVYYRVSGLIAVITLSLNILIVLAVLVGLEATLTLPGIAGIALTIGMAVDANIIIYERIREEIRKGVSNYKSV